MPQVELKFSKDVTLDIEYIFKSIETEINSFDKSSGACKCRAYPTEQFLHTHVALNIALLRKPHRDKNFMNTLLKKLESILEPAIPSGCFYAVELFFSGDYYLTQQK